MQQADTGDDAGRIASTEAYWGAGGTIGLALTYGYTAGRNAVLEAKHRPT